MSERARQLHAPAGRQIGALIVLASTLEEPALRRVCPGREKLGDGTIAASVQHTADNFERIASFVQTSDRMSSGHGAAQPGGHRIPRSMRALGHPPPEHAEHGAGGGQYTVDNFKLTALLEQLADVRDSLTQIAELTDSQLDAIPPDGSFRFCDGKRTLEKVLASLLKHQARQVQALEAALTEPTAAEPQEHPR